MSKVHAVLAVAASLREASAQLEEIGDETAHNMRRHVEHALAHAPEAPRDRDEGDFAPGTTIGGEDNLRRTQALEGEQIGGAPSPSELLSENARLQERVAQLEAQQRGEG